MFHFFCVSFSPLLAFFWIDYFFLLHFSFMNLEAKHCISIILACTLETLTCIFS